MLVSLEEANGNEGHGSYPVWQDFFFPDTKLGILSLSPV